MQSYRLHLLKLSLMSPDRTWLGVRAGFLPNEKEFYNNRPFPTLSEGRILKRFYDLACESRGMRLLTLIALSCRLNAQFYDLLLSRLNVWSLRFATFMFKCPVLRFWKCTILDSIVWRPQFYGHGAVFEGSSLHTVETTISVQILNKGPEEFQ